VRWGNGRRWRAKRPGLALGAVIRVVTAGSRLAAVCARLMPCALLILLIDSYSILRIG